eukprot:scaffold84103_cov42-Prasinocladus_malaysianus.AAC.1
MSTNLLANGLDIQPEDTSSPLPLRISRMSTPGEGDNFTMRTADSASAPDNELAAEVSREQEHLMLMQDQVDKQKVMLQKELNDLAKKLEQERTQRATQQSSMSDNLQMLRTSLTQREADVEDLEARVLVLESRGSLFGCCGGLMSSLFGSKRQTAGLDPEGELMEPLAMRHMDF